MAGVGAADFSLKVAGAPISEGLAMMVQSVVLDQALNLPAQLDVTLFGQSPLDVTKAGLKIDAEIEFGVVLESETTTLFKGKIASLDVNEGPTGLRAGVRAYDALYELTKTTDTATYSNVKVSDVITSIAGEAGMNADVSATTTVYPEIIRAGEQASHFLARLAAMAGLVVVFVNGKLHAKRPDSGGLIASAAKVNATFGINIFEWTGRTTTAGLVSDVTVRGWDPLTKETVSHNATARSDFFDGRTLTGTKSLVVGSPVATASEATERAARLATRLGSLHHNVQLRLFGDPKAVAGGRVLLERVGAPFNGTYVISHVVHRIDSDGYTTEIESASLQDPTLLGSTALEIDVPQRSMAGPVVAQVTNINDPDNYGRVKVKYPWLDDDAESGWTRVLHPGAGPSRGLQILPDVGDEVLVAFQNGDLAHPIVTGGLYNGKDKPSRQGVENSNTSGPLWQSRSGHKIELIDKQGSEAIMISSGDGDTTVTIDKAGKKVEVKTGQYAVNVKSGGAVTVESTQDVTLKGTNVTIEAKVGLTLKGATAKLEASGPVEVKGAITKIN